VERAEGPAEVDKEAKLVITDKVINVLTEGWGWN